MAVIGERFVYDVSDPLKPRLICRATNSEVHVVSKTAVAYTTTIDGRVVVVRRDLASHADTVVGSLPVDPSANPFGVHTAWESDASMEVYMTYGPQGINGTNTSHIHLWSMGTDHLLFDVHFPSTGFEDPYSPMGLWVFSPDQAYVAVGALFDWHLRIFSTADAHQVIDAGASRSGLYGGTWLGNNRFVWAAESLMQWTPAGGISQFRSERWYQPVSSADGTWFTGTDISDRSNPRVKIISADGAKTFDAGRGSSAGFVGPTVVWYSSQAPFAPNPAGTYHAFDVKIGTDTAFHFKAGEEPTDSGISWCCGPEA